MSSFQVFIRTLSGRTIIVDIFLTTNVLQLKELCFDREGVPPRFQRILYNGRQLTDIDILGDAGVVHSSVFHVLLKLH